MKLKCVLVFYNKIKVNFQSNSVFLSFDVNAKVGFAL